MEEVEEHFRLFEKCRHWWGIQDEDVYNFDETGFQISVTSGEKVIVLKDTVAFFSTDPDNKELITLVETVNPCGRICVY